MLSDEIDSPHPDKNSPLLSVVLISRNQRWNIERLITSARRETSRVEAELVLIDSASTDGTPETAAQLGVRTLRLHEGQQLSPAAGRFVGYQETTGKTVLFLDGDAELVPGWLDIAFNVLDGDSNIAAVTGARITLPISGTSDSRPVLPESQAAEHEYVTRTGGSALYRRDALDFVGPFDPFLRSEEEPELALRLRYAGFELVRTTHPIIFDYTDPPGEIRTVLSRRRRRLYLGTGQVLRKHWGKPTFRIYAADRKVTILATFGSVLWLVLLMGSILTGGRWPTFGLAILSVSALLALAMRNRTPSFSTLLASVVREACHVEGTLKGLFIKPEVPSQAAFTFESVDPPR